MKIVLSKKFLQEVKEILAFIAKDNPQKAIEFYSELKEKIENVSFMPLSYRINQSAKNEKIRDLIFKGYTVPFKINQDNIRILGIYGKNIWKIK